MVTTLRQSTRRVPLGTVVVFALALAGLSCSKGMQSVSGTVLHKGQPIKGAVVTFHPKGGESDVRAQRPTGVTDEAGKFSLSTGSEKGAPPGDYVVTVLWLKAPDAPAGKKGAISTDGTPDATDLFQGRYADAKNSKLSVTIKSGVSELEPIKLE